MSVTALVLASMIHGASAGGVGADVGLQAVRNTARHRLHPAVGVYGWTGLGELPVSVFAEVAGTVYPRGQDVYRFTTTHLRGSVVAAYLYDAGDGLTFQGGLGPAVTYRSGRFEATDDLKWTRTYPGLRVVGLATGEVSRLQWRAWFGITTRELAAWEYDMGFGMGLSL